MKKIDDNVFILGHSMVLIDKGYDFISLFIKGNNTLLQANQIKKIHVFTCNTKSLYKLLELLDEISIKSKTKIIFHVCSIEVSTRLSAFIKNNDNHVNFKYDYHRNKEQYNITDDSGKLAIYPFKLVSKNGMKSVKYIVYDNKK